MEMPSPAPLRSVRDPFGLDDEWLALCEELRRAQRAKLDFLAALGRRACHRRGLTGVLMDGPDTDTLVELQHAIDQVDERMRRFITDDVNRRPLGRDTQ